MPAGIEPRAHQRRTRTPRIVDGSLTSPREVGRRFTVPGSGGRRRERFLLRFVLMARGQESLELRPAARLRPIRDIKFPINIRKMELHRLFGHPEHALQLRVRVTLGDELEDLQLPPRQVMAAGCSSADEAGSEKSQLPFVEM